MTGNGSWRIEKGKFITRWVNSKSWEEWDLPINPRAATGHCHMAAGNFSLRAEAMNIVELAEIQVFSRTPESKRAFINGCNTAVGKVQIAHLNLIAWLSGIAIAYADAFEAHNRFLKEIDATAKLANDLLLGFALAFLGGAAGGLVGDTMKELTKSGLLIDGIKDLAKFSVRGPGSAALGTVLVPAMPAMPTSPLQWQNGITERVTRELATASANIDKWRQRVEADDDTFNADFSPADVTQRALVIGKRVKVPISQLEAVDKARMQAEFEKGWLVGWIPLRAITHIPLAHEICMDKIVDYGRKLGIANIEKLVRDNFETRNSMPIMGTP